MNLTRNEREVLNALSLEVFGASSRWQKLVTKGYKKIVTRVQEETVPAEKEGDEPTVSKIDVPVLYGTSKKSHIYNMTRYTVEGVRDYMIQRKTQLDMIRAELKKRQEEAQSQKAQEQLNRAVNDSAAGSAI